MYPPRTTRRMRAVSTLLLWLLIGSTCILEKNGNGLLVAGQQIRRQNKGQQRLHPDILQVIEVVGDRPGGKSWADSYSVGDRCYCRTSFDHNIGPVMVETPFGWRSVQEICNILGPGPGWADRPIYNDVQCGNGPVNDAIDETHCPGRVDIGPAGCGQLGPRWKFTDVDRFPRAPYSIHINCGDNRDYDDGSTLWMSDEHFQGGSVGYTFLNFQGVEHASDQRLFRKRRIGNLPTEMGSSSSDTTSDNNTNSTAIRLAYNIPVPRRGLYKVQLYFAETVVRFANRRVFSVSVEGEVKLPNYDIFAKAGGTRLQVTMEEIATMVLDGELNIEFLPEKGRPQISAIAVYSMVETAEDEGDAQTQEFIAPTAVPTVPVVPTVVPTVAPPTKAPTPTTLIDPNQNNFSLYINCGGDRDYNDGTVVWQADTLSQGGITGYTRKALTGANAKDQRLYGRRRRGDFASSTSTPTGTTERTAAFEYKIPVPRNGAYKVELYFVETAKQSANKRIFSVHVEGAVQLSQYDIFAAAGGRKNHITMESILTRVNDGELNIEFYAVKDRPEVSAIAVHSVVAGRDRVAPTVAPTAVDDGIVEVASVPAAPTTLGVPARRPPPPLGREATPRGGELTKPKVSIHINCGDNLDYHDKGTGILWKSDYFFQGGVSGYTRRPFTGIGANAQRLYGKRRRGYGRRQRGKKPSSFEYNIPVHSSGDYHVQLYFVETMKRMANKRLFSVSLEGEVKLSHYDIFSRARKMFEPIMEEFFINVNDGELNIQFLSEMDRPEISAIAVYSV